MEPSDFFNENLWNNILELDRNTKNVYQAGIDILNPILFTKDICKSESNPEDAITYCFSDALRDFFDRPSVYFLYDRGKKQTPPQFSDLVYIGITKNLMLRIAQHFIGMPSTPKKIFDCFGFIFVKSIQDASKIENILVSAFKPKYNDRLTDFIDSKISDWLG